MSSRVTGVVLIYALFAAGWILFSDSLVALLLTDPEYVLIASTLKGWAFVGVTSLLLWGLLRRFPGHTAQAEVEAGSLAESGQLVTHPLELEPGGEEAGSLGALSGAHDR